MKPVIEMTAAELRDEFLKLEAAGGIDGAFAEDDQARWNAVHVELVRRCHVLESAQATDRRERVQKFAHSAATVITNLWHAHGGADLEGPKVTEFATLLFDFFRTVR